MEYDDVQGKFVNLVVIVISFIVIALLIVAFAATTLQPIPGPGERIPPHSPGPEPPRNASKPPRRKSPLKRLASLDSICPQTDYESSCRNSLASINGTVQDYIRAAIDIAIQETSEAKQQSQVLANDPRIENDYQASNDCIELISLGEYDLKAAFLAASNDSLFYDQPADIKNRLSAVIAYQEACLDGLMDWRTRLDMENAFERPKQTVTNALAIIDVHFQSSEILSVDKSRRLEEYPWWFSHVNRKLIQDSRRQPDAVVAVDGSGQFRTTGEALDAYKLNGNGWYVIYVKAGMYNENVFISKNQTNVYIYGDGFDKTVIFGSRHSKDGFPPYRTAIVAVLGDGFVCKSMSIQNRAKSGKEAVALRIQADKSAIFNCKIEGSVRTLHALAHRQFYRQCIISGSQDLIYGDSSTVIQQSLILIKKPDTPIKQHASVTVQTRSQRRQATGFVLHKCRFYQEPGCSTSAYLGRPGGEHSRTIVMQSELGNGIDPQGWNLGSSWRGQEMKFYFGEFENSGPGADPSKRVKLKGSDVTISKIEAGKFTTSNFIQGNSWLGHTGVPFADDLS